MSRYLYRVEWPILDDTRTLAELEAEAQRDYLLKASAERIQVDVQSLQFSLEGESTVVMVGALTSTPPPHLIPPGCPYCDRARKRHAATCRDRECVRAHERYRYALRNGRRRQQHAGKVNA